MIKGDRIKAIDRFRGLSIFYMIFGHSIIFWLRQEDQWLRLIVFLTCEVIGANLFILLAGVSLAFTYHSQKRKIAKNPEYTTWHSRIHFGVRTLYFIFLGFCVNIVGNLAMGQLDLWIWNILITIAFARLVCYPCLRLTPQSRVVIGAAFFIYGDLLSTFLPPIGNHILFTESYNVVFQNTPFPFFGFLFIGTALGDWLNNWRYNSLEVNKSQNNNFTRNLAIIGIILVGLGILTGYQSSTEGIILSFFTNPNIYLKLLIDGLPIFLIRGSSSWSFYSLGIELLILVFLLQLDIRRITLRLNNINNQRTLSNNKNKYIEGLSLFGQTSLTLYLTHSGIFFIFSNTLNIMEWSIAIGVCTCIIYFGMWLWSNRGKGIGTLEWVIRYFTIIILDWFSLKRPKKSLFSTFQPKT